MKLSNSFFLPVIAVLAIASCVDSQHLRSQSNIEASTTNTDVTTIKQRRLFFEAITTSLDQIIKAFLPALNLVIQSTLSTNLEAVELGLDFVQILPNLQLGPNCSTTAELIYELGLLTGLGSFQIDSVDLEDGSDRLEISFLGLNGASWGGTWNVKGRFNNDIEAASTATIKADACGFPIEEVASGTISAQNAGFEMKIDIDGSTPSLFNLGTSTATAINIEEGHFIFDAIESNIDGLFGNNVEVDLATIFDGLFTSMLFDSLLPLIVELLEDALGGGLQF